MDAEIATRTARQCGGELGVGQWNLELGLLEQGSAEMSLLIVMFQSRRREEECKRRVVHSRRWVRASMVNGPAGPRRIGLQVTSELDGPTGRRPVASEGPAGRVGWAGGSPRMGLRVSSDEPAGPVGWARGSHWM